MARTAVPVDVHEAILDAATHLMERYGYRKMTMDDVAREARIGKATIYGYFCGKEAIGLSVLERYHARVEERWREIDALRLAPPEWVRALLVERVLLLFDIAQRHQQSLDETLASLRHLVLPRREQWAQADARRLAEVLREGVARGVFECENPLEAAQTLLTCTNGLLPYSLSPRELAERAEVEARANRVVDMVFRGLLRSGPR